MEQGRPIWVESLMTEPQYKEWRKLYPHAVVLEKLTPMFECEFKWRWRMGETLLPEEIEIINKRLDELERRKTQKG